MDESQGTIAPVGEPVTMALVDPRRAQRSIEQLIELGAQLGLNGIGTGSGTLYVDRDDSPVMGQTCRWRWCHQASLREGARSPAHSSPRKVETIGGAPTKRHQAGSGTVSRQPMQFASPSAGRGVSDTSGLEFLWRASPGRTGLPVLVGSRGGVDHWKGRLSPRCICMSI